MTDRSTTKQMTWGEGGLAAVMAAFAVFALLVAANAHTQAYAFHAYVFSASAVAAGKKTRNSSSSFRRLVKKFFTRPAM